MKTKLTCPCGMRIEGADETDLVERAQQHLQQAHPGLEYGADEILAIAI